MASNYVQFDTVLNNRRRQAKHVSESDIDSREAPISTPHRSHIEEYEYLIPILELNAKTSEGNLKQKEININEKEEITVTSITNQDEDKNGLDLITGESFPNLKSHLSEENQTCAAMRPKETKSFSNSESNIQNDDNDSENEDSDTKYKENDKENKTQISEDEDQDYEANKSDDSSEDEQYDNYYHRCDDIREADVQISAENMLAIRAQLASFYLAIHGIRAEEETSEEEATSEEEYSDEEYEEQDEAYVSYVGPYSEPDLDSSSDLQSTASFFQSSSDSEEDDDDSENDYNDDVSEEEVSEEEGSDQEDDASGNEKLRAQENESADEEF